jgi:VIT1/CCC1 family predicted Fe2+/Mn2+ transporter
MQTKTIVGIILIILGIVIALVGACWYFNVGTQQNSAPVSSPNFMNSFWNQAKNGTIDLLIFAIGCLVAILGYMIIDSKHFQFLAPVVVVALIVILVAVIGYLAYKT